MDARSEKRANSSVQKDTRDEGRRAIGDPVGGNDHATRGHFLRREGKQKTRMWRRRIGIACKLNRTNHIGKGSRVPVKNVHSIRCEVGYRTPIMRPRVHIKHLFILDEDFPAATVCR